MGMDRLDLQFVVKEAAMGMANPTLEDALKLKRLGRYISNYPNLEVLYLWGCRGSRANGFSDSDWAGCRKTRRSTSGGCITVVGCIVKSRSRTQRNIALSSGEAEWYAAVRTIQEMIGIQSLGRDLGLELDCNLKIDARATVGMLTRRGLGKVRHLEVNTLWVQNMIHQGKVSLERVSSTDNIADIMTKYVPPQVLKYHLQQLHMDGSSRHATR